MEVKHELFQYKIDGWCIWPVLRFAVYQLLTNLPLITKEEFPRLEKLSFAIEDIVKVFSLHKARFVVKTYSSAKGEIEGGLYKDIFFDDLLADMGSYYKIEALNSVKYRDARKLSVIKSDMNTFSLELLSYLPIKFRVPRRILKMANILSGCFQKDPGLEMLTSEIVMNILLQFFWLKRLYSWLLKRINPEYVLVADSGEYIIAAAAKELGIKVIEFQHGFGLSTGYHPSYWWPPCALAYKKNMPVPDRIFLFGEHSRQQLAGNGFWDNELRAVGNVRIDQYRGLKNINKGNDNTKYTIVLTTQGLDTERLAGFIANFVKIADKENYRLYIKLHPAYETSKEIYEVAAQQDGRVSVLLGSEPPSTYELLAQADMHVSISSSCHYEALGLGVPTVILPMETHELVLPLYEQGVAFLAQSPEDLLNIMVKCRTFTVPTEASEWFFKCDALNNIKRELKLMCK
ncbi:MAG: hypothetical protein ACYDG5_08960 [Dehalococcoidales bacterium]